ncbi:PEP-CTERM sorting domain-containing protein [Akkermansiaceae bacterium]|nr:PEP-CTERM sorting domain-containing protein [Akkermansiaceae bacterium]MDB4287457.1 PEP-CTERM sorting domain-containing protein [bacterium]MDA7877615.1 PEP-CTERM sorting domain-containing protein [Akkermansiaceae bacterium]MDA7932016.1 PEP-CTERM sorting domain-containing protein [Akkermansiaceae bacterium]MDA8960127.1 PEP-CTERM sorting domain-containing protein [Akkermansiaceae bacterium]
MSTIFITSVIGLSLATNLTAAVMSVDIPDIPIPSDFDGIYLDFDDFNDPGSFTTATTEPADWDINFFFGGAAIANSDTLQPVTAASATLSEVIGLAPSDTVSGSLNYPTSSSGSTGHMGTGAQQFDNGETGFIGFRIEPDSFAPGSQPATTIYGYMKVTLQDDGTVGAIHTVAWDPTGAPVVIPEPSSVALSLLALAAGITRRRRI